MSTIRKLATDRVELIQRFLNAGCRDIALYKTRIADLTEEMEAKQKEADNLISELNELNKFLGEDHD